MPLFGAGNDCLAPTGTCQLGCIKRTRVRIVRRRGHTLIVPLKAKMTLAGLKAKTERWGDRMNVEFTEQKIDDLAARLNAGFHK